MKTLAVLREKERTLRSRLMKRILDLTGVVVTAKDKPGFCEICQGPMCVQKTFQHEGRTITHGTFNVHETVWVCTEKCRHPSGELVTQRANSVVQCIMPNSIIGYDLMVWVTDKLRSEALSI